MPAASRAKQTEELDAADALQPYQAGYRDITFPGLDRETPKWLLQALRRIHTNLGLGHPPKETLVRHLVHAGAHDNAIRASRHLQCEVCRRVAPPRAARPIKPFVPHRFNDRLSLDSLFLKDIRVPCVCLLEPGGHGYELSSSGLHRQPHGERGLEGPPGQWLVLLLWLS